MDFITKKSVSKENESRLQTILVMGGVCFFVGRACFADGMAPVGAALLMTLLMYNVERLGSWHKAIIAGAVMIIAQSVWYIADESICSISEIAINGGLTAVFCGIFEILSGLWGKKKANVRDDMILLSVSAVAMLMVIGIGAPWLLFPAAIILAVFSGYIGGIAEGLISGFASGMLLFICQEDPMQILWLLLFAVIAGFFKNSSRWLAGIAISAAALASTCFQALPAAALLIIMPEFFMVKIEMGLREIRINSSDDSGQNLKELSLLFSSLDNPRSRLAYEFKAMSQLYQQKDQPVRSKRRHHQQAASAGYAGTLERCGDSCLWETLPDGRFAIALSDGMGKGEPAAQESHLAVTSVIKMLKAGLEAELVLKLLNAILMLDTGQERFSTMDLALLEPESGEMHFYKIGAAPTLIKRKDKIEILTAPAMPMGVIEPSSMRSISTIVRPGDQVIMMTDGVIDSVRDDMEISWLRKVLLQIKSKDPQTVCDLIIREASANYGDREKDDMTVVAFRVR